jgi:phospholipase C
VKIDHVFVMMLENRSFDHLLAFSSLPGVVPPPASFGFTPGAVDQLANDPPHEFDDVAAQINGGAMDGFAASGGPDTMNGFDDSEVPVLVELARNNLYFDNWFSSMPGPTWPNRLFAHAASSGGLDNSLGAFDADRAVTNPGFALLFENGHIFDRLSANGVTWRIYHHHRNIFDIDFPQALCLKGMVDKRNDPNFFRHFSSFVSDVAGGDVAGYTFIEPKYGLPAYSGGNSQHPTGTISLGEILIKRIHDAIFGQKIGANSALLVTWDEHGGFFDHATPPAATPPGDKPLNHARANNPRNCRFNRFGVRVPAVLISPWLPAGLGSQVFGPKTVFDHASIVRALRSTFSLGGQLTNRDGNSPDWNSALLANPRSVLMTLPRVAAPKLRASAPSLRKAAAQGAPSGNILGTAQIAIDIDWHTAERLRVAPLIVSDFRDRLVRAGKILSARPADAVVPSAELEEAHLAILEYISAVRDRDERLRKRERRQSRTIPKGSRARTRLSPSKGVTRKRRK